MKLNTDKCKLISISRTGSAQPHRYGFDTTEHVFVEMEHVRVMQDLGITVDDKLSFENHISDKIIKAYQMLGLINRNFKQLDKFTFIMLYKRLVRSLLEYGQSI